jgi:hypothetical protein
MAKCVQFVGQGVPVRCTDDEAFQIVERDLDGQYCSKGFWRKWYAGILDSTPDGERRRSAAMKQLMAASA